MATGNDPLSKFIENQMVFQNFVQEQQQFGAQQALATRQLENQELGDYFTLLQQAQRPEEMVALRDAFSERTPQMKDVFASVLTQVAPTMATQAAGVVQQGRGGMTPEQEAMLGQGAAFQQLAGAPQGALALDQVVAQLPPEAKTTAVAIQQGREVTAAQREQLDQALAAHNLNIEQFFEQTRQFGVDVGLRQAALAQQGELGRLSAMTSGGLLPLLLQGEQSTMIRELQGQLETAPPAQRSEIEARLGELKSSSQQLSRLWEAAFPDAKGGPGSMTLAQMFDAQETAARQYQEAKDPGSQALAAERYNMVQMLLGELGGSLMAPRPRTLMPDQTDVVPNPWFGPGGGR